VIAVKPSAAPSGGGSGTGPALGSGAGGGTGGNGYGADEGGTDLEQIAGEITSSDYPRTFVRGHRRPRGVLFTSSPTVASAAAPSPARAGAPQLDALTAA